MFNSTMLLTFLMWYLCSFINNQLLTIVLKTMDSVAISACLNQEDTSAHAQRGLPSSLMEKHVTMVRTYFLSVIKITEFKSSERFLYLLPCRLYR